MSNEEESAGRNYNSAMSDASLILAAMKQGDPHAAEQLLPLVYDDRAGRVGVRRRDAPVPRTPAGASFKRKVPLGTILC